DFPQRRIAAALFGRLPTDYDTALIGIEPTNGTTGAALANKNRALGAPLILEVDDSRIRVWTVSATKDKAAKTADLDQAGFREWVGQNADSLRPTELLRSKNLKHHGPTCYQRELFAGLIPEIEERVAEILEPRLTVAFRAGWDKYESVTGHAPAESNLFKVT